MIVPPARTVRGPPGRNPRRPGTALPGHRGVRKSSQENLQRGKAETV